MRTLAIDCATEACSVALLEGATVLAAECRILGRGHAEHLVPMIAALPDRGRAERILVSRGPGSFTGVRIGIAAARALGVAWRAEVLGYPTLALVAAMARARHGAAHVTVCMSGGHGEWFVQDFATDGAPATPLTSLVPAAAAARSVLPLVAGSQAAALADLLGDGHEVVELLPDAGDTPLLPPALITGDLTPIYGRSPDARLPG
jgi:tRNA threonylcarbamoyladenosine biosynthesis protein TsaB